ncbi:type IV conjugative transfer system protein TraE [Sphingomonas sp. Leaf4]|uniref:type IV conjugative transfer system protein TraE n=1 Tax=Sphingomonas sp. Leaf4 TaxID=2876553 RepID=UPI001E63E45F|nr:type IV conjugative transfer system protein TraE [Sphingomonas sp. Leaf4]
MDLSYQHAQGQRILRQRNMLGIAAVVLAAAVALLLLMSATRSREIVLQPILRSPVTVSSAGVSRDYLEQITRDVALLTLNRSPNGLDYWMESILAIVSPRAQGKVKADLLKIVDEQRGSSIAQFFSIQSMQIDTDNLRSRVTGELTTIAGQQVISREHRTFRFDWDYSGLELKLVGFGMEKPATKGTAE